MFLIKPIKYAVSGKRSRYIDSVYDLDLTYITDRVIAMGYPGQGIEGMYRNNLEEVAKFLKEKHPGHYMIWNLSEKEYNYKLVEDQVLQFGFPDHHNPPLDLLFQIVKSIDSWLKADPKNVSITHCLAGKGRTGTVIACYLLYSGLISDPHQALKYFLDKRKEGVTSPSQVRYVEYFHHILKNKTTPYAKPLVLKKAFVHNAAALQYASLGFEIYELVSTGPNTVVKKLKFSTTVRATLQSQLDLITFACDVSLQGDVLIVCKNYSGFLTEKIFRLAFHTGFVPNGVLRLKKADMDNSVKNSKLPNDFMIDLMFVEAEKQTSVEAVEHLYQKETATTASPQATTTTTTAVLEDQHTETHLFVGTPQE